MSRRSSKRARGKQLLIKSDDGKQRERKTKVAVIYLIPRIREVGTESV